MSNKTINQALTDLYLGLGGDSKELEDNTKVSDYIEDLEGAIKGASSSLIDDSEASEDTTYSSSKIEAILPDGLPEVTSSDEGKVLSVSSEGEWVPAEASGGGLVIYTVTGSGANERTLPEGKKVGDVASDINNGKMVVIKDGQTYLYPCRVYNNSLLSFYAIYKESTTWTLIELTGNGENATTLARNTKALT